MLKYDEKTLERLLDGELTWDELNPLISGSKDLNRFDKIIKL